MKKRLLVSLVYLLVVAGCASSEGSRSLIDTWILKSYGPADAQTPALPDVNATVTFDADGGVGGTTGCNQFGGAYQVSGDQINFDSIVATLVACPDPQMAQEDAVLRVLVDAATYRIEGNTLTIENNDLALNLTAAGP